jgi:GNAT superfamily N-acetyltransferase
MHIERVDPAAKARDLAAILPAIRAAHLDFVPGEPVPCGQRVRFWTGEQYQRTSVSFAAFADPGDAAVVGVADGEAIGVTMGGHPAENPDLFGTWSFISPEVKGPEIAAALLEQVSAYCRDHGIERLMINTAANADAERYAPQRGTTPSFVGIRMSLDLTAVDREEFAAFATPSATNGEYRLVHWVDACPDELAAAYCVARAAMNDAPRVEGEDKPVHDLERLRGGEAAWMRQGVRVVTTAAVAPDGAIAGFGMIALYPEQPEFAEIHDTGVAREHRGHGLGVRIKAAATLQLLRDHPGAEHLYTFNAQDNAPMIAVNRRLGYRDAATWETYVHDIAEAPKHVG